MVTSATGRECHIDSAVRFRIANIAAVKSTVKFAGAPPNRRPRGRLRVTGACLSERLPPYCSYHYLAEGQSDQGVSGVLFVVFLGKGEFAALAEGCSARVGRAISSFLLHAGSGGRPVA
jgi:hypothetical protein